MSSKDKIAGRSHFCKDFVSMILAVWPCARSRKNSVLCAWRTEYYSVHNAERTVVDVRTVYDTVS